MSKRESVTTEEAMELKHELEIELKDTLEKFTRRTKVLVTKVKVGTVDYGDENEEQLALFGDAPMYDRVKITAELS